MQIPTKLNSPQPLEIGIVALDGAIYSSIIGPLDVFSVANMIQKSSKQTAFSKVRILRVGCDEPRSFNQLNNHRLKVGGFKSSAESTDTGRRPVIRPQF